MRRILQRITRLGLILAILWVSVSLIPAKADTLSGKEMLRIGKGAITLVTTRPDGTVMVVGVGGTVTLYDEQFNPIGALDGHKGQITQAVWSDDSSHFATADDAGMIILRDATTGKPIKTIDAHTARINSLTFSEDGKLLISGSDDKTAKIWNADTGDLLQTLAGHTAGVTLADFSIGDQHYAYTYDLDKATRIWDVQTGKLLSTINTPKGLFNFSSVSADLHYVVTNTENDKDNAIVVYDALTGTVLQTTAVSNDKNSVPSYAFFSRDDSKLAVIRRFTPSIELYTVPDIKLLATLKGHTGEIYTNQFSRDSKRFVSSSSTDGTARLYDAATGHLINVLPGHTGRTIVQAWSEDGTKIITSSDDNLLHVWDGMTGHALATLKGHGLPVSSAWWNKQATTLFSIGYGEGVIYRWDGQKFNQLGALKGYSGNIYTVCWSMDGTMLASGGSDDLIHLWDAQSGSERTTLKGHANTITDVAWNADGSQIASASADKTAKLWDVKTGRIVHDFNTFKDSVYSVALNLTNTSLAIGSRDSTAFLSVWSTSAFGQLNTFHGGNSAVSLRWSPNNIQLAVGSSNNHVTIWDSVSHKFLDDKTHTDVVSAITWTSYHTAD